MQQHCCRFIVRSFIESERSCKRLALGRFVSLRLAGVREFWFARHDF